MCLGCVGSDVCADGEGRFKWLVWCSVALGWGGTLGAKWLVGCSDGEGRVKRLVWGGVV